MRLHKQLGTVFCFVPKGYFMPKNNISLGDTNIYGPVSTQLQNAGAEISDSFYKDYSADIFSEFRMNANKFYRLVQCYDLDEEGECDLCAHDIYYGCEIVANGEFVTNHPAIDTRITWPERLVIGSTCVKMLGIDSYPVRFVRSCFKRDFKPKFKINSIGLAMLGGSIVNDTDKWLPKFDYLVLPHSVFNLIPQGIMRKAGLKFHVLRTDFDPKRKLEAMLYRSFNSKHGKWRTEYTCEPLDSIYADGSLNYNLATVITRDDARRIVEIYKEEKKAR